MPKYLLVTMPDESVWKVPAFVVARDAASNYSSHIEDREKRQSVYDDDIDYYLSKDGEYDLIDWAKGNMDWSDVNEYATLYLPARDVDDRDKQEAWVNGPMKVIEL